MKVNEFQTVTAQDGDFEMYLLEDSGEWKLSIAMVQTYGKAAWTSRFVLTAPEVRKLWDVLGDQHREMEMAGFYGGELE